MNSIIHGIGGFQVLKPSNLVNELIAHVESQLPLFIESHTFEKIMVKKKNETQHSTALSVFMMKSQDKFTFMNETAQKGSHKIDIGVYEKASDDLIFTIEAKLLPTPPGTKLKPRAESEYVNSIAGESGAGINRFKTGHHGLDNNEKPLIYNGMIAYVKEYDFSHWQSKINQWITDASWDDSEKLQKIYFNRIAKLKSTHTRNDRSQLVLHHFWVLTSN